MKRRREERIAISVPVRVWGMDAKGKPFSQTATTLDITRTGARLGGLTCLLQQGDTVGVQHGTEKSRFRVVWVGRMGGPQQGQAGIYCSEAGKNIWSDTLNRLAKPTGKAPTESPKVNAYTGFSPAASPDGDDERRGVVRYPCAGSAQVTNLETGFTTWGTVTDISVSGCYVETALPLPPETTVNATISFLGTHIKGRAEVRASHPAVGMGLHFLHLADEDQERLTKILERMAARSEQPDARPASPQPAPPPAPDSNAAALSTNVYKMSAELREVEAKLVGGSIKLDPRIVGELRRTMDQARQTAWAVQQFLEHDSPAQDSYRLLDDLEARRIRSATELIRDLVLDVDSQSLQVGSEGVAELIAAVAQLHRRLTALTDSSRTTRPEKR